MTLSRVAGMAGLLGFFASDVIGKLRTPVLLFDAAGLCLFAVTGTQKALAFGLDPVMAAILGMITCIGGGVARDLLTQQIPGVLRPELYAVAAPAGAGSVRAWARRSCRQRRSAPASVCSSS